MKLDQPAIFIIFGITGDLSKRKLLPALHTLIGKNQLPEGSKIIGITRRDISKEDLFSAIEKEHTIIPTNIEPLLEIRKMDLESDEAYCGLKEYISDSNFQKIVCLSVPHETVLPIITKMGENGFGMLDGFKLLFEKPFGSDLESAKMLTQTCDAYYTQNQMFRVDHYVTKPMVQYFADVFQKKIFDCKEDIQEIHINAREQIGIEGRAAFYETAGALKDLVQSHLLLLAALTLMSQKNTNVAFMREEALKNISVDMAQPIIRGQYKKYKEEAGNPNSTTETFVSLWVKSSDPFWEHVPVRLLTGKELDKKLTEIKVIFKPNACKKELIIEIDPAPHIRNISESEETILETIKVIPNAYESTFLYALEDKKEYFLSEAEVLECWRIVEPILNKWKEHSNDLILYDEGAAQIQ